MARPFRLIPRITRSPYGGTYIEWLRARRLLHLGNWGRLLRSTEGRR